jgi:hypothetical protein
MRSRIPHSNSTTQSAIERRACGVEGLLVSVSSKFNARKSTEDA